MVQAAGIRSMPAALCLGPPGGLSRGTSPIDRTPKKGPAHLPVSRAFPQGTTPRNLGPGLTAPGHLCTPCLRYSGASLWADLQARARTGGDRSRYLFGFVLVDDFEVHVLDLSLGL